MSSFIAYTRLVKCLLEFLKFTSFKIESYILEKKEAEKIDYSMAGFRHFCYLREKQIVV